MTRPPEDFLSRWSRRKHQAAKEASRPEQEPDPAAAQHGGAAASPERPAKADAAQPEPVFDLSKLPSLESIGPDTDVRIFMQPGVPPALAHAALRRAWSADPSIRDFIGLSENSWDFTNPDAINGFGPLLPVDDVKKLLAQVLKDDEPSETEERPAAPQQVAADAAVLKQDAQEAEIESNSGQSEAGIAARSESLVHCTNSDSKSVQAEPAKVPVAETPKRRHGGALPL
jgi:hypothetical protein